MADEWQKLIKATASLTRNGRKLSDQLLNLRGSVIHSYPHDDIIQRALILHVPDNRHYIQILVNEINGSYREGFYNATGALLRRLFESLLIDALEKNLGKESTIDESGNRLTFEKLIEIATANLTLPRGSKKFLQDIKKLGNDAVHGPRSVLTKKDIDDHKRNIRKMFQELTAIAY